MVVVKRGPTSSRVCLICNLETSDLVKTSTALLFFFFADSIEANVESSEVHVERATDQLQRAAYYQVRACTQESHWAADFTSHHSSLTH